MAECLLEGTGAETVKSVAQNGYIRQRLYPDGSGNATTCLVWPGVAAAQGNGSNRFISFPGLVTEEGWIEDLNTNSDSQAELDPAYKVYADGGIISGLKGTAALRTAQQLTAKNSFSRAFTGYIPEPELCMRSSSGADWRAKTGILMLTSQYAAWPALLWDDRIQFWIPFFAGGMSRETTPRGTWTGVLHHAKIGTTFLHFFWRQFNSQTKKNAVNMKDASAFAVEIKPGGAQVTYTLSNGTGAYACGIVAPANLSNAIRLICWADDADNLLATTLRGETWGVMTSAPAGDASGRYVPPIYEYPQGSQAFTRLVYCQAPVSLTGVTALVVPSTYPLDGEQLEACTGFVTPYNSCESATFGVFKTIPTAYNASFSSSVAAGEELPGAVLDVSGLTGNYYLGIRYSSNYYNELTRLYSATLNLASVLAL